MSPSFLPASICMRDVGLTAATVAESNYNKVVFWIDYRVLTASTIHGVGSPREVKCPRSVDPELSAIFTQQDSVKPRSRKKTRY